MVIGIRMQPYAQEIHSMLIGDVIQTGTNDADNFAIKFLMFYI